MFISNSVDETEEIGEKIGKKLKGTEVIALWGEMGKGKTALTRGIAKAFDLHTEVSSPTFAIINEYNGPKGKIFHFDMYRVQSEEDLESTGFYDYISKGLMIIEWSENIRNSIPFDAINISINSGENENQRKIKIEGIEI